MKPTDKIRVAVLYGGRSAEHEVSLLSATNVIQFLDKSRFEVIPIGINKQGRWILGEDVFHHSLEKNNVPHIENRNFATWFAPEWVGKPIDKKDLMELQSASKESFFDVVFPALHGTFCEDGSLQGLLELADIPYVGCGVLASAIAMDKDISKRLAREANVKTAAFMKISHDAWLHDSDALLQEIMHTLTLPVFVKPANTGSSIGIHKVTASNQLSYAVNDAFRFDTKVLIEKAINAIELEVAVLEALDDVEPIVSVAGEIRPTKDAFYTYAAKYLDQDGADLLIPAPIRQEKQIEAQTIAKKIFKLLECQGMARVDLFCEKDTQEIYFNEINTIPGFTQISMYPKLLAATGIAYPDLLTHLIELAMKKHKKKSKLVRNFGE